MVLIFLEIVHGHKTFMGFIVDFTVTFLRKVFLFLSFVFKLIAQRYFFALPSHGVELCIESIDVT